MSPAVGAAVRVAGLEGRLLAHSARGDGGHQVVSARLAGRDVVVKLYGRKRAFAPTLARAFGHRFLVAKTGLGARTRRDTEARVLRLWRAHGFAVPEVLPLELPAPDPRPHLVLEHVAGRTVSAELRDPAVPLAVLEAGLARFAPEWSRRHDRAEAEAEPALVHAHPSFNHAIDRAGEWVYFDFEYAYTDRRRVAALVDVEIAGFVASLAHYAGARFEPLLAALVAAYPAHARLDRAVRHAAVGRFPLVERASRIVPALRGGGPRKQRESLAALGRALGTAR
jgi:tRNA A-37 threonylcarbamoyl transferase component Bud32